MDPLLAVTGAGSPDEAPGIFLAFGLSVKLDEWNSRSSCRSVCPRSPWELSVELQNVRVYSWIFEMLIYLFIDVHYHIISSSRHFGS